MLTEANTLTLLMIATYSYCTICLLGLIVVVKWLPFTLYETHPVAVEEGKCHKLFVNKWPPLSVQTSKLITLCDIAVYYWSVVLPVWLSYHHFQISCQILKAVGLCECVLYSASQLWVTYGRKSNALLLVVPYELVLFVQKIIKRCCALSTACIMGMTLYRNLPMIVVSQHSMAYIVNCEYTVCTLTALNAWRHSTHTHAHTHSKGLPSRQSCQPNEAVGCLGTDWSGTGSM